MSTKTNADMAGVSVPTVQQVEHLILDYVIYSIEGLNGLRRDDADWDDDDVDTDMAADLALWHFKRMRAGDMEEDGFDLNWWTAASAIHLGHKAFGRPESIYGRSLARLVRAISTLYELPRFGENRAAKEVHACAQGGAA